MPLTGRNAPAADFHSLKTQVEITGTFTIRARLDLNDIQDTSVATSGQVRKAITKIEYDQNGDGDYTDTYDTDKTETTTYTEDSLPDYEQYYLNGKTIRVYSNAKIAFTTNDGTALTGVTEDYSNKGYVYTFSIPKGVNVVTAKRVYDYSMTVSGNELKGHDKNTRPEKTDEAIATLNANNHEYLESLTDNVNVTYNANYELVYSDDISYYDPSDTMFLTPIAAPSDVGKYLARAAVSTSAQDMSYNLSKEFNITPRDYALHSGDKATTGNEMTVEIKNFNNVNTGANNTNSTVYTGNPQQPEVTITDTKRAAGDQTLVQGRDYELYYKDENSGDYVKVAAADNSAFAKTDADTYTIYVKFINNYKNGADNAYVPVTWTIEKAILPKITINDPTSQVYDYKTHPVTLTPDSGTIPENVVKIEYTDDTVAGGDAYSETAPTDAGKYTANISVINNNYKFAEGQVVTKHFTINPKPITLSDQNVTLSPDTYIYDATAKTPTAAVTFTDEAAPEGSQNITLVEGTDYTVEYSNNTDAGTAAKATITSQEGSNYTFTPAIVKNFTINPKVVDNPTITLKSDATITYDGTSKTPAIVVKDGNTVIANTEYTVAYKDNVNAGTAKITVTDKEGGNYTVSGTTTFTIAPKNISGVTIAQTSIPTADTDGETAKTPDGITVTDEAITDTSKQALELNKDYENVTYSNNYNASNNKAVVTITGKGNYTGTATGKFSIKSTIDLTAVKSMITSVECGTDKYTSDIADEYNFVPTEVIKIVSQGVLAFKENTVTIVDTDNTSSGYVYEINIKDGVNLTTVSHVHDYTDLAAVKSEDGKSITLKGKDTNNKNSTEKTSIATLSIDDVYYLDDVSTKVHTTNNNAPGVTLTIGTCVYSVAEGVNNNAALENGKPAKVGKYKVSVPWD